MTRVAAGDHASFGEVYDRTSRRVLGLAVTFLGPSGSAEEAAVDAYGEAWKRSATFDPSRGSVLSWLLTITRSVCLDRLRTRHRESVQSSADGPCESVRDPGPSPSELCAKQDLRQELRTALESLPSTQRQALEVAFFGGLSYTETAHALQLPEGTVKARIRAALGALRQSLSPRDARS